MMTTTPSILSYNNLINYKLIAYKTINNPVSSSQE
jgi:hypothetical protein